MPLFMNPVDTPSLSIYTRNRIFLPMRSWMSLRQKQSNLQLPWLHDPKTGYQGTTTGNNEISAPNPRKEKILIEQKIILLFFFFFTYTYMHAHTVTPMSVQASCLWHYNWTPKQLFCTHVMQEITNVLFWIFPYTPHNDFTGDCAPPRGQSTLFMPHCRQQNWSM